MQCRTTGNVQRFNPEFEVALVQQSCLAPAVKDSVVFDRIGDHVEITGISTGVEQKVTTPVEKGFWLFTDVHVERYNVPAKSIWDVDSCRNMRRRLLPPFSNSMSRLGVGKWLMSNMFSPRVLVDRSEPLSPVAESISIDRNARMCVTPSEEHATKTLQIIASGDNRYFRKYVFAANEDTTPNVWRRKNTQSLLVARAEEALSSRTVNIDCKRKNTSPLLAIRPEDALFIRSIRRRYTPATSNICHAKTNRNSPFTTIQNLSSNTAHAKDETPSYMDLGDFDQRYTPATSNICRANTSRNSPSTTIQNLSSNTAHARDDTPSYMDLGDCDQQRRHCGCLFWYNERLKGSHYTREAEHHLCCGRGQIYMPSTPDPPAFIQLLFKNNQFMEHIRAYKQMLAMTSFGAKYDHSVNKGRGPYVFKISSQIYHWIGSLCPEEGHHPRFLQLYVYDTRDELSNRMHNFDGLDESTLNPEIIEGLIHVLDEHNSLVRLLRNARDRCNVGDIPSFKIRLYNIGGVHGYELPTADVLGAIVFENGPRSRTDFDVIIEFRGGSPQRINKLHQSYMLLQFPLLFIFGQPGYYSELTLKPHDGKGKGKK
nr:helitron helicase-like domain-containing protein [Tanacetum cinerariifolium]